MKKIMGLAVVAALAFTSCSKSDDNSPSDGVYSKNEAVITGYDMTECGCCGGYFISIVNNPPYGKDFLAKELPSNMQLTPGSSYPVRVEMEWKVDTTFCDSRFIKVRSMKLK